MSPAPGSLQAWVAASRPKTLAAALVPVAVGSACAFAVGGFRFGPALAALLGAMGIQVGTNIANDFFDHQKGADREDRLGPARAVATGLLTPGQAKVGTALAFAFATAMGVYLALASGWAIFALGVVCILAGIGYTGGPFPLAYKGWGDLFVLVFFGYVAVCGTAWVQALRVPDLAVFASLPVGALATALLVVNNVRDRHTDARADKATLVVRLGRRFGELEYDVMLAAAYLVPLGLLAFGWSGPAVLLPLLTLPHALRNRRALRELEGAPLNALLGETAKLLLRFGLLFAAGLALGG